MKKKLSILFGVVLLIGFIAFSMQKLRYDLPKSWKVNLVQNSKDPYGLYVMHEEIGNLSKGKVHDLEKLSELKIDPKKAKDYAVVVIGSEVYFDTVAKNLLSNIAEMVVLYSSQIITIILETIRMVWMMQSFLTLYMRILLLSKKIYYTTKRKSLKMILNLKRTKHLK